MSSLTLLPDQLLSTLGRMTSDVAELFTQPGTFASGETNDADAASAAASGMPPEFPASLSSLPSGGGALQSYRFQQLSLAFRSVEIAAQRTSVSGGVMHTASLLVRRITIDIRISSTVLERYAESISALQESDPELIKDLLELIGLLDESTPDMLDPFFDRLRMILSGAPGAQVAQPEGAAVDINVPVPEGAETGEQVSAFFFHMRVSVTRIQFSSTTQERKSDPLVLDLDRDGVELTSCKDSRDFDIDADGKTDHTAFVTDGDAFLALDRNGNGTIDDGSELFGDQHGAVDGFAELSRFDDNTDGAIDLSDSVFSKLFLFDGDSLSRLADAGIVSILTTMDRTKDEEINGNDILGYGCFSRADGSSGAVADALLSYI